MKRLKNILKSNHIYRVIALLILFYSLAVTLIPNYKSKYDISETNFLLRIEDYQIDGNKLTLTLCGEEKIVGTYYIKTKEEKDYFKEKLEFDDLIEVKGELTIPNNNTIPNSFNYKKYLYFNKIYYKINIEELKIIKKTDNILYKLKNIAYKRASSIDNKYIYAYILGNTDNLSNNILSSYRTNSISHLFALSGLHVCIFSSFLLKILKKLKPILKYFLVFLVLLIFTFITGFSPSMLRAVLLFFLIGINKIYNLNIKTINILFLTFSIIVLLNPFIIYQVGFILTFTTTFFLIISSNLIKNKTYILSLLLVSTISFISSLGVSLYFFGSINILGILFNLIFVPFVSYIIFPLTIIVYIFPYFNEILTFFTSIMENLSLLLTRVNLILYFPSISIIIVFLYYFFLLILIKTKKKWIILPIILILILWKIYPYLSDETLIYFLDVGQGDSALILTPHKSSAILIDTGGKIKFKREKWKIPNKEYEIYKDTLIPFMRSIGVYKLNYLILTHGDYDHMGEAQKLVENFKVEKVIFNCGTINELEENLIKLLKKKGISYYSCIEELNIENNKLYLLNKKDYNNENDNSSVIYTEVNNHKFLFMGDAGIKVEQDLIKKYDLQDIDVLKVGHHGSKTSSSLEFLKKVEPKTSIISSGLNNRFNHPNIEVLNRLKTISKVYNTAYDGTIQISINKKYKIKHYKR